MRLTVETGRNFVTQSAGMGEGGGWKMEGVTLRTTVGPGRQAEVTLA